MASGPRALLALAACALVAAARSPAVDDRLFVRPWVELEPFVWTGGEYPVSPETGAGRMLEEARVLLSAMVYGWKFDWTPGDSSRGVADRFEIETLAEIPKGSDRLIIRDSGIEDRKLWAQAEYRMSASELLRRSSWAGVTVDGSSGAGEGSAMAGPGAKVTAIENAVKDAIRLDLHDRVLNRPRTIRGEVVLWADPQLGMWSGAYHAVVSVKLRVTELVPYSLY